MRWWLGLFALASLAGCDEPDVLVGGESGGDVGALVEPPPVDPERILWSGCAVVDRGRCEREPKPFHAWVPGSFSGWRWTFEGQPFAADSTQAQDDGTRFTWSESWASSGSGSLELRDEDDAVQWSLEVVAAPSEFSALRTPPNEGIERRAVADELLEDLDDRAPLERLVRLRRARSLLYDGSDIKASSFRLEPILESTVALAASLGRWNEQCDAASIGVYLATFDWKSDRADRWARWDEPCRQRSTYWAAAFDYYLGVLALRRGYYEEAAVRLQRSEQVAPRVQLKEFAWPAAKRRVEVLVRTGRWAEARRALRRLDEQDADVCTRALLDSEIGTYRVLARRRGDADLGDPTEVLLRALALHEPGQICGSVRARNHDLIKLGLSAALDGDTEALGRWLGAIDPTTLSGKFVGQYQELRVLDALARYDLVTAHQALESARRLVVDGLEPEIRWRVNMLRAELGRLEGDDEAAREAYEAAEAVVDELARNVTSGAIRERWTTSHRGSALRLVDHLVDDDRIVDAACVARKARARALAMHDAFALRSSPSAELLAREVVRDPTSICRRSWNRRDDELVLLVVPRGGDGWWIFEIHDGRVRGVLPMERLPTLDDNTDHWWDPWSDALSEASSVRVLASEAAFGTSFHELGWRGTPLAGQRAVVYGLDLAESGPPRSLAERRAVVAFADVDPMRSLGRYEAANAEVDAVLLEQGWDAEWIEADAVDRSALREHSASVALLHYYGHGIREGVDAPTPELDDVGTTALLLADDTRLGVDDVLGLPRVPPWVVLFGCRVGHADLHGWSGGLSLAHAFLLAGSEQVIASTEVLDASTSAALGPRLYEGQGPASIDLSDALRVAWAEYFEVHRKAPPWSSLRVFGR
ncbi:MAG: CHAT domain-containing protein [Myxococcota bacterium]